jgi:hypothetical protein
MKKAGKKKSESEVGYGKPPKHTRFKPGNRANPLGAGAHYKKKKTVKKLTSEELAEVLNLVVAQDKKGLEQIRNSKTATVLQIWIASIALRGINSGDPYAMDKLLERMIGKVPQAVHNGGPNGEPLAPSTQVVVMMPPNGREKS